MFPVVSVAFCTMDGLVDIGWTAVVSCNHEVPIVEYFAGRSDSERLHECFTGSRRSSMVSLPQSMRLPVDA